MARQTLLQMTDSVFPGVPGVPGVCPCGDCLPPVHDAACSGNLRRLRHLLSTGTPVDARDSHGRTPLFLVRSVVTLRFLLERGARPEARDAGGLDAPAYWASRKGPPFRPREYAILIKEWPGPAAPVDWHAMSRAAALMGLPALKGELARWGGIPSRPGPGSSFLGAAARSILCQDQATTADAERLVVLAGAGECLEAETGGARSAVLALLALQHCPPTRFRQGSRLAHASLWRALLDAPFPRESLDVALRLVARERSRDFAALLQVRMSAAIMGLRGARAFGLLRSPDAGVREGERARWGSWGIPGALRLSTLLEPMMGPRYLALDGWVKGLVKAAQARPLIQGAPWGHLLWILGHVRRNRSREFWVLRDRLAERGADLSLDSMDAPCWEEALAAWRARAPGSDAWFSALAAWRSETCLLRALPAGALAPPALARL